MVFWKRFSSSKEQLASLAFHNSFSTTMNILFPPPEMEAIPQTGPSPLSDSFPVAKVGKPIPVHTWENPRQLTLREFLHIPINVQILTPRPRNSSDASCHLCTRPRWLNRVTDGKGWGKDCQMFQFFSN